MTAVLLPVVVVACFLGVGSPLAARLRAGPLVQLCVCVAASHVAMYLFAGGLYLLNLPWSWAWLFVGVSGVACAVQWKTLARWWHAAASRQALLSTAVLVAWWWLLLTCITSPSGANWSGDFYEHFHRTRFFMEHLPTDTVFLGRYAVPARPPLTNLAECIILAVAGRTYPDHQLVLAALNATVFLPCALWFRALTRGASPAWLLPVFMTQPLIVQNATFGWTKLHSAMFVLLGVYLHRRRAHGTGAALALAAGILAHYSAIVFALPVLVRHAWRRRAVRVPLVMAGALMATWVVPAVSIFGASATASSNSAVTDASRLSAGENVLKIAGNIIDSVVPATLRAARPLGMPADASALLVLREETFTLYQHNAVFACGLAALLVLVLLRARWWPGGFLGRFVVGTLVLGFAVHGDRNVLGLVHVSGQPAVLLVLVAAAALAWRWQAHVLMGAGMLVDALVGVLLNLYFQGPLASERTAQAAQNAAQMARLGVVPLGDAFPTGMLAVVALALVLLPCTWLLHDARSRRRVHG